LDWAKAVVPRHRHAATPIFLFGTAGMRRLKDKDCGKVLAAARTVLANSGFRFEDPWARVLSGRDEGIYGWTALNAAAQTLGGGGGGGGDDTLGTLDLGGSSLEVSFSATDADANNANNNPNDNANTFGGSMVPESSSALANVTVLSAQYSVYTYSHRHFGLDDAFDMSVSILLRRQQQQEQQEPHENTSTNAQQALTNHSHSDRSIEILGKSETDGGTVGMALVRHPCLHEGYKQQFHRKALDGSIAPSPPTVILVGSPEYSACVALARDVIVATSPSTAACTTSTAHDPCTLGVSQARFQGRFVALTGFYVVLNFFGIDPKREGLGRVPAVGRAFCEKSWEQVSAQHAGEMAVETYCFRAPYVMALIETGLHLDQNQVIVGGPEIGGWTLGAALVEGGRVAGFGKGGGGGGSGDRLDLNAATAATSLSHSDGAYVRGRWPSGLARVVPVIAAFLFPKSLITRCLSVALLAAVVVMAAKYYCRARKRREKAVLGREGLGGGPREENGEEMKDWPRGLASRAVSSGGGITIATPATLINSGSMQQQQLSGVNGGGWGGGPEHDAPLARPAQRRFPGASNIFHLIFGNPTMASQTKKASPLFPSSSVSSFLSGRPPAPDRGHGFAALDGGSSTAAVGRLGMTRSQTYSRRLSSLESGAESFY